MLPVFGGAAGRPGMNIRVVWPHVLDRSNWNPTGFLPSQCTSSGLTLTAGARASGALVEGRLVPTELVLRTLGLIGIAWSGVMLIVGFIVFRRKELAIYSGQGG